MLRGHGIYRFNLMVRMLGKHQLLKSVQPLVNLNGSFLHISRGIYLYRQQSLLLLAGGCRMVVGSGRPTCNLPGRSCSSPPMLTQGSPPSQGSTPSPLIIHRQHNPNQSKRHFKNQLRLVINFDWFVS